MSCRSMAHAKVALNFNAFLEKTKLKDDGMNLTGPMFCIWQYKIL